MTIVLLCFLAVSCGKRLDHVTPVEQSQRLLSESVFEQWSPPCGQQSSVVPKERLLDLESLCLGEACISSTYGELVDSLGPPDSPECVNRYRGTCSVFWSIFGLLVSFDLSDTVPGQSPSDNQIPRSLHAVDGSSYVSVHGVGVDKPVACLANVPPPIHLNATFGQTACVTATRVELYRGTVKMIDHSASDEDCDGLISQILIER